MSARRRNSRAGLTLSIFSRLAAAISCAGIAALTWLPAHAAGARTLQVTPSDQLTYNQYVNVSWTGFDPNEFVKVYQCPMNATSSGDCAASSPSQRSAGDARIVSSDKDGKGSTPFIITANDVVPVSGGAPFFCDSDHACRLVAVQLDHSGGETAFTNSVSAQISFALSTTPCPVGGDRISGAGATSIRTAMREWQSEVCRNDLKLDVSYTSTNSLQGMSSFANGLADTDFALSGMPLTADDLATLGTNGVKPVYAPLTAGSLVLVYNLWVDENGDGKSEQVTDLQLSPSTVAKMIQGRITSWDAPEVAADNPQHHFPLKQVVPVGRADNSAATWWLTSWLWATARDDWKAGGEAFQSGPTAIFPSNPLTVLATGSDAVANYVRNFPGGQTAESKDVPRAGYIGYVYLSEAQKFGLPVAAIKNAAGDYVGPTSDGVAAAFADSEVSPDGIFTPNFNNSTDHLAYPVPVASYLIAPSGDSKGVDPTTAKALGKLIMYADGPGQQAAVARGYIPLPTSLKTASDAAATKIADVPAAQLQPSEQATNSAPVPSSAPPIILHGQTSNAPLSTPPPSTTRATPVGAAPRSLVDAVPAAAKSVLQSAPVQAVKRAIAGVLGLSDVGFVPIRMPTLLVGGLLLIVLGRVLRRSLRRGGTAPEPRSEPQPAADEESSTASAGDRALASFGLMRED